MLTNTLQKNPHQAKMTKNPLIRRSFEHIESEAKNPQRSLKRQKNQKTTIHKNIKITPTHGCEKQGKINKKHNHF